MPITHSRRPPGRRDTRRRPEGHAPLSPRKNSGKRTVHEAAPTVQVAVDFLREQDKPHLADAVKTVLDYATTLTGKETEQETPLSLTFDQGFLNHVTQQAGAEGVTLAGVVFAGFAEFLDGTWKPPQPKRRAQGVPVDKDGTSMRFPTSLIDEVNRKAETYARRRRWDMGRGYKLNAQQIAVAALARRFGVEPEIPSVRGWDARLKFLLNVPEEFRDFVRAKEEAGGPDSSLVLRDAFAAFLDGSWTPAQPPRAPRGQGVTKVRMTIQVNEEIRDQVEKRGKATRPVAKRGYQLTAVQVALAALVNAYDVPERLLYPWAE